MSNSLKQLIYCQQRKTLETHPKIHLQLRLQEWLATLSTFPSLTRALTLRLANTFSQTPPKNNTSFPETPFPCPKNQYKTRFTLFSNSFLSPSLFSFLPPFLSSFPPSLSPYFPFFLKSMLFKNYTQVNPTPLEILPRLSGETVSHRPSQPPSGTWDSSPLSIAQR